MGQDLVALVDVGLRVDGSRHRLERRVLSRPRVLFRRRLHMVRGVGILAGEIQQGNFGEM
jgi:hypothetical protein